MTRWLKDVVFGPVRRWRCEGCGKTWDQRRSPATAVPMLWPHVPSSVCGPWHAVPCEAPHVIDGFAYGGSERVCGPVLEGHLVNVALEVVLPIRVQ